MSRKLSSVRTSRTAVREAHDPQPPTKICPVSVGRGGAAFSDLFFGCRRTFPLIDGLGVTVEEKGFVCRPDTIFVAQVRFGFAPKGVSLLTLTVVFGDPLLGRGFRCLDYPSDVLFCLVLCGRSPFVFGGPLSAATAFRAFAIATDRAPTASPRDTL